MTFAGHAYANAALHSRDGLRHFVIRVFQLADQQQHRRADARKRVQWVPVPFNQRLPPPDMGFEVCAAYALLEPLRHTRVVPVDVREQGLPTVYTEVCDARRHQLQKVALEDVGNRAAADETAES